MLYRDNGPSIVRVAKLTKKLRKHPLFTLESFDELNKLGYTTKEIIEEWTEEVRNV